MTTPTADASDRPAGARSTSADAPGLAADRPLTRNWWAFAVRGIVAIAFGVLAIFQPGATLATLTLLFGAYAFIDGVSGVFAGIGAAGGPRWLMVLGGIAGIAFGVLAFARPDITAFTLLIVIGYWSIVIGISQIVTAYRMRKVISGETLLALNGTLAVAFGVYLLVFPGPGAVTLVWLIAWYAIVSGVLLLMLAYRARRSHGQARLASLPGR